MRARAILLSLLIAACGQHRGTEAEQPPGTTSPPPQSAPQSVTQSAQQPPVPSAPNDSTDVVERFGKRLKNVPLLAPKKKAAEAIRANYSDLVEPTLLARWTNDPSIAPGRRTSSPWPDRIEIESADQSNTGEATMRGVIVEITSTGEAGRTPVQVRLRLTDNRWLISGFEELTDATAAEHVVEEYYKAIASRHYKKAYAFWGPSGPPGQSFAQFVEGFRDTASVTVQPGEPGRIGAAAGSRYIEVPVKVNATTNSGSKETFEGAYTLRRAVVDGATAEQRAWHIYSGSLHRTSAP